MDLSTRENTKWEDVTEMFRKAAEELSNILPMVHTEEFSLLDSMAAVEIMDPIMDQCYGIKGSMKTEDLLRIDYPSTGVTPTIAVKLFQSLFVYEAAFQDGASLMESLNQCIFAWEGSWAALAERNSEGINGICERAILAYCKSLVYSTSCQFKAVLAADIYEDEDFQPNYKNMLSDKNLNAADLTVALESIITELTALQGSDKADADATVAYLLQLLRARLQLQTFHHEVGEWVHSTVSEYTRMLKARQANNAAMTQASAPVDTTEGPYRALDLQVATAKKRSHSSCLRIRKLAKQSSAALQSLLDIHAQGVSSSSPAVDSAASAEGVFVDIPLPTACTEIAFALNSKIVKLHQTGPIRRVTMKPYLASVAYLQSISREFDDVSASVMSFFELQIVSSVAEALAAADTTRAALLVNGGSATKVFTSAGVIGQGVLTMDYVLQTTMHLSAACPHLLTRCYYMAALHVLSPQMHGLIWGSLYCRGLPRALIESDLICRHWIVGNPSVAVWDSLKGLVVCRSRLLASRIQNMLDLWSHVSSEAIFVDTQFLQDINASTDEGANSGGGGASGGGAQNLQWCSLWALVHVISIMDLYMSLMMEMDLVGPEEWDYFYWYWDYLASTGVFAAEKLRTQRFQLDQELYEFAKMDAMRGKTSGDSANSKKSGGKNGKKKKAADVAAESAAAVAAVAALPVPVMLPAAVEELLLKGRGSLCRGVYRMSCLAGAPPKGLGYTAEGAPLIDKDEGRYSSWEVKFQHRFQPFAELSNPPPVSYSDFLQSTGRASDTATGTNSMSNSNSGRNLAYVENLTLGAMGCFQHAKKSLDDARKECGAVYAGISGGGADKYVQNTIVSLTKVSVASSLSTMRLTQLVKEEATIAARKQQPRHFALGINRSYNKHFAVLEFTAPPAGKKA